MPRRAPELEGLPPAQAPRLRADEGDELRDE